MPQCLLIRLSKCAIPREQHMNHGRIMLRAFLTLMLGTTSSPISFGIEPQEDILANVRFINSCSLPVQVDIDRAVAMLHSFQYGLAEKDILACH